MEDYADDDEVIELPCRHMLHKECLLSWAKACARPPRGAGAMATCPLCKAPLAEDAPTDDDVLPRCCYILCCVPPPNSGAGGDARYERVGDGESSGGESRRRDGVPAMV